jgi:SNF2 family DNA or RNA helicase
MHRDRDLLGTVPWRAAILDEAQNIKNPASQQARTAQGLRADYRIALTGTPVENHVGDLWSIMQFLNPGLLGSQAEFKRNYFQPIQAGDDGTAAARLQKATGPFILRRLKTDRSIIDDLPDKSETKQYCNLTREQATLYQAVLREAETRMESAEGMKRRGSILDTLTKLKQACNHPRQLLGDNSAITGRSGKLARLQELFDEILPAGDRVLVFSQFAEMGAILQQHVQETYGLETPFLHGGVTRKQRDRMVERFQNDPDGPQVFVLSLKAGGSGLNLPRANHVIHYDRWWNPAVENQATDRAFRIGQTRDVHVHKLICAGTLEDRIDLMIEIKQETADQVVGTTSERWLTELSNAELRDVLALSANPVD